MSERNISDQYFRTLTDTLKKEINYYKDLLDISVAKRKIIVENKVSELDNMLKLEHNMIFDIGQLEKSREDIVKKICFSLGLNPEKVTLAELALHANDHDKKELAQLQRQLTEKLSGIKDTNDLNGELIKQSLEYIDYSINVITSSGMQTSSLYEDVNDSKGTATKKRLFDTKI
jgi:flagellar biosynthesis/type III secretory pathway chaperone